MRAIRDWWSKHQEAKKWIQAAVEEDEYGLFGFMEEEARQELVLSVYVDPGAVLEMCEYYKEGRTPEAAWDKARHGST